MRITEHHTITLDIDGVEKIISLADAQALYDALGGVRGIRRHGGTISVNPYRYPWTGPFWTSTPINATRTSSIPAGNIGRITVGASS
jgi:hypothetical protein